MTAGAGALLASDFACYASASMSIGEVEFAMDPFFANVVGKNRRGSWLVIREGHFGSHELVWAGDPAIQKGDRIYVTPAEEGEDDLVVALYVAVMHRQ